MQKATFQILIGQRIKDLRISKGLSQTDLANMCGKDSQSLERVENGKTNATTYYLFEICKGLNISLHDFFNFKIESKKK